VKGEGSAGDVLSCITRDVLGETSSLGQNKLRKCCHAIAILRSYRSCLIAEAIMNSGLRSETDPESVLV